MERSLSVISPVAPFVLISLILILIFIPPVNGSQPFYVRTWGGTGQEGATAVAFDSAGDIYVTGETSSFHGILLLKYTPSGSLLWQKVWGGGSDGAKAIAVDGAGNVYIAGIAPCSCPGAYNQALLLKVNSTGSPVIQVVWGVQTDAEGIALSPSGDVYVTGFSGYLTGNIGHLSLLKFDANGSIIWQKTYSGNNTRGTAIATDSFGNIFVTGVQTGGQSNLGVLLKLNATGGLVMQDIWSLPANGGTTSSIALDSEGNVIVGGYSCYCQELTTEVTGTISKLAANGFLIWQREWMNNSTSSPSSVYLNGVAVDASGHIYAAGGDAGNLFLLQLDPTGRLTGVTLLTGKYPSSAGGIALDASGIPAFVGVISGPLSTYRSINPSQTLSKRTPVTLVRSEALNDTHFSPAGISGYLNNVNGSTTYAGMTDVLLVYGNVIVIPIPTLSSYGILLLGSMTIIATKKMRDSK